eukprot:CAMPEP_0179365276 /NCGR_PEP_ID=MMETSP0797-20121207/82466_1 /TAXON_ID=47934 /ORGANISM="Dinophysis acuminata, Strain DAEP01" /LENGTH=322 /DNA_ID=CAMNT_0021080771 /DNA_START=125 /DNA_END=1094 /DNA_ORIENTATION=-
MSTVSEATELADSFHNLVQSIPCRSSQERKAGDLWAQQQALPTSASNSSNSSNDGSMRVKRLAQDHDKSTASTCAPSGEMSRDVSSTSAPSAERDRDESSDVPPTAPDQDVEDLQSSSSHHVDAIGIWAEQLEALNDSSSRSSSNASGRATPREAAIGAWGDELQALNEESPQEKAAAVLDRQFKIANYVHGEMDLRLAQMGRVERKVLLTYYWYNLQAQRAALEAHLFAPTSQEAAEELEVARQKIKQCADFLRDFHGGREDASALIGMCPKNANISQRSVMTLSMKVLTLSMRFMQSSNQGVESWTGMPCDTRTTSTLGG